MKMLKMKPNDKDVPLLLCAKDKPCKCHTCVQVNCSGCDKTVFQTIEKMDVYDRNKARALHMCVDCMSYVQRMMPRDRLIEVNLDKPISRNI